MNFQRNKPMKRSDLKRNLCLILMFFVVHLGVLAAEASANTGTSGQRISSWTGTVYTTTSNLDEANRVFLEFLSQNRGNLVFLDFIIDMSLWDEKMAQNFERLGLEGFSEDSSTELRIHDRTYLTLQLLENHRLIPVSGGTGVFAFPVLGFFWIEIIPGQRPLYILREVHPPDQRPETRSRANLPKGLRPSSP
ncbi:MAG: hypothetical protein ACFB21_12070 [Opitutales bacterium]